MQPCISFSSDFPFFYLHARLTLTLTETETEHNRTDRVKGPLETLTLRLLALTEFNIGSSYKYISLSNWCDFLPCRWNEG
jgi:hypothetical protein